MVVYAGALAFALVGALALCTDVAVMYVKWQYVQKVADAAAMAGSNYLTSYANSAGYTFTGTPATGCSTEPDAASQVACTYAVDNGLAVSNVAISEPSSTTIQVVAKETGLPYYFAKTLGMGTYAVTASATAQAGGTPVSSDNSGMFPVGLQCNTPCNLANLDPGQSVTFGSKFVGGLAPGNWDWLGLGGTGASTLGSNIQNGASGTYSIGDTVSTSPGNKGNSGPVKKGLDARLASCPTLSTDPCADGGNPKDIPAGDPCLVVVPAVNFNGCTGKCSMTIEGFAEVYLEQDSTGTSIQGCFVNLPAPNTVSSSGSNPPSLGAITPPTMTQ